MAMMGQAKIIATIGPASDDEETIKQLVKADVAIWRFNFKHNTLHWHETRLARVRKIAPKTEILIDLRGPEGRMRRQETLFKDDLAVLDLAKKHQAEWVALSFVRHTTDIQNLQKVLQQINLPAKVMAKIENQEGIDHFHSILRASDAVMVARGDLGEELPIEQVPYWQKKMIKACRQIRKPVIVATEMLESMVKKPKPTRAEIADIAQAVDDGADFLMLSAETAIGRYPLEAVRVMKKTIEFTARKRKP